MSSHIHICTREEHRGGRGSQREAEQQSSAHPLSCSFYISTHILPPGADGEHLCVGEVRPVRYLRGDAGTPAHALLTAPTRGCPPHCLGAILYTSTAAGDQGSCRRVAPGWGKPTSLPPALLHGWPSRTGVIVVMAAVVAWPRARTSAAPLRPRGAPGWVLLVMVTPAGRSPGKAIAEDLRGDVG